MRSKVYLLFSFFNLYFIGDTLAQAIEWDRTFGGKTEDYLADLIQTSDGGYLLGGYSTSGASGDKVENCRGSYDYWLLKLDASTNILWQKTIGGNSQDILYSFVEASDGGFLIAGSSSSPISGDKTKPSLGSSDYWIIKIDDLGNIIWERVIGGSEGDGLKSIVSTVDGGYLLGGSSESGVSGDKNESCRGFQDYWLVKLDQNGFVTWQKTLGGDADDYLITAIQTADNGFLLAGSSTSGVSGDKTEANLGDWWTTDYWIIKLDKFGNTTWQSTIGGDYHDYIVDVIQTIDGGFLLTGNSASDISGDKTEVNLGGYDYWVVKINASGSILWQNTIGGNEWDNLESIIQTSDGNYLLAGWSYSSISGDKTEINIGGTDYWVVKIDSLGGITDQATVGGTGLDQLHSVIQTSDGGYLLGGNSWSTISGDKTEACRGYYDYWIVKLAAGFIVSTPELLHDDELQLSIFPNPSSDYVMITVLSNAKAFSIQLFDIMGKEIFSIEEENTTGTFSKKLDLSHLSKGMYTVNLRTADLVITESLIVH